MDNKSRAYINKKRKLKRKRKRRRFFFALIVLIISFTLIKRARLRSNIIESTNNTLNYYLEKTGISSPYKDIKMDTNENYNGVGQEKISGEGYFTKFTTVDANKKTFTEYKQNVEPWKDNE